MAQPVRCRSERGSGPRAPRFRKRPAPHLSQAGRIAYPRREKVDRAARAPRRAEDVTVSEGFRVSVTEEARKLGIKAGDRLRVKVERGAIILEPVKPREALERLASIADRLLGGLQRVDAVKLVEEALERA